MSASARDGQAAPGRATKATRAAETATAAAMNEAPRGAHSRRCSGARPACTPTPTEAAKRRSPTPAPIRLRSPSFMSDGLVSKAAGVLPRGKEREPRRTYSDDACTDQGEARGGEGHAARRLRPARGGGRLPPGPVLLGHAARSALRRREGAAPSHLRRDVAERARRARPLHAPARQRVQALSRGAPHWRGGRGGAAEGDVRPP